MARAVSSGRTTRTKKSNGNGSGVENTSNTTPNVETTTKRSTTNVEEMIRRRAYELFQQSGARHGQDQEHWFRAESEIRSKSA